MKFLVFVSLFSLGWAIDAKATCTGSGTAWSCAAGSTSSDVQSAINSASDGAVITFASGSYSITSWVRFSNNKGVTLICASPGTCTITSGGNIVFGSDTFGGTNTRLYRVSGFVFDQSLGHPGSQGIITFDNYNGSNPVLMTQIRVDHNTVKSMAAGSALAFFGNILTVGNFYGVVDHNTLTGSAGQASIAFALGTVNPNPPPQQLGTGNNIFVEDNILNFTVIGNASVRGCSDAWGSPAALVFRHNTSLNCLWATHGVTHAGGPSNVEFYNNTVKVDAGAVSAGIGDGYRLFHHQGSGTFVAFNNSFTSYSGKNGEVISVAHYRDYLNSVDGGKPICDGTYSLDGNRPGTNGYPCWNQPGRVFGSQALSPMYAWNNFWSDTLATVPLVSPNFGGTPDYHNVHMQPDREWYNAVPSFDGSTGMGFGPVAKRPATCTTNSSEVGGGVGYFATDVGPQGTLYRCSATNTWTIHYVPYTYPHPLVTGSGPSPTPVPTPSTPTTAITFPADGQIISIGGAQ